MIEIEWKARLITEGGMMEGGLKELEDFLNNRWHVESATPMSGGGILFVMSRWKE